MFEGQPKGLFALALANTGERFGYYTMLACRLCFVSPSQLWARCWSSWNYLQQFSYVGLFPPPFRRYDGR